MAVKISDGAAGLGEAAVKAARGAASGTRRAAAAATVAFCLASPSPALALHAASAMRGHDGKKAQKQGGSASESTDDIVMGGALALAVVAVGGAIVTYNHSGYIADEEAREKNGDGSNIPFHR